MVRNRKNMVAISRWIGIFVVIVLFIGGCAIPNKTAKSEKEFYKQLDADSVLQYAINLYRKEKYFRAQEVLSYLLEEYRTHPIAEKAYYYYALTFFGIGEPASAGYHLHVFINRFPESPLVPDAYYWKAYALYAMSLPYNLDQTYTKRAIEAFQLYLNLYPEHKHSTEAKKHIKTLRRRLQKKDIYNAELYYKIGEYLSAKIALTHVLEDWHDLPEKDYVAFLIIKSAYLYAINSVEEKQVDRLKEVMELYHKYEMFFKDSQHAQEVKKIYEDTKERLNSQS